MTVESSYHSANPEIQTLTEQSKNYSKQIMTIVDEVQKVIVGQEEVIKKLVIAMMADGHVLLEGVPGLAKTKMVDTLSKTLGETFVVYSLHQIYFLLISLEQKFMITKMKNL